MGTLLRRVQTIAHAYLRNARRCYLRWGAFGKVRLGLSICRSIVEAHGGRLWASANVPRGAIFQFTMPVVEEMQPH